MKRPANQCPLAAAALARPLDDARARGLLLLDARDGRLFERSTGVRGRHRLPGPSPSPPVVASASLNAQLDKMATNPLLAGGSAPAPPARPSGGGGPITGYGALAAGGDARGYGGVGGSRGRGDGYWGPKPGAGYGGGGGYAGSDAGKRKYGDVWAPSGAGGTFGKQPKAPKSTSGSPKKVPGATKDGSPWHPPSVASRWRPRPSAPCVAPRRRPPRRASSRSLPSTA